MIPTKIHHKTGCRTNTGTQMDPQPPGFAFVLFECPECGQRATSPESA